MSDFPPNCEHKKPPRVVFVSDETREEFERELEEELIEEFGRERCWSATVRIRATSEEEARGVLKENLIGIGLEVDDFEFEEVPIE